MRRRQNPCPPFALAAAALTGALAISAHATCDKVYTTTADFKEGTFFNTQANDPADQVQLVDAGDIETFGTLYVANAGEDTLSKIDTNTNKEVGRYRTWFNIGTHGAWSGPAPSRSAVDGDGNAYIANRMFDGRYKACVLKILGSGGVDRNGNGTIETSVDTNNNGVIDPSEILPVTDMNGDGIPQINEFADERIVWITYVGANNAGLARSLSIDPDGNLYVGLESESAYYKLQGSDGAILGGPFSCSPNIPYGSLIDSGRKLWGAGLFSGSMLEFDTSTNTFVRNVSVSNYGIAIGNGKVYLANNSPYATYDPATMAVTQRGLNFSCLGISTAANGDIMTHGSAISGSSRGVTRFKPDGTVVWQAAAQTGATSGDGRGVIPDANGDFWTINLNTHNVSKVSSTGAPLGVFPVGLLPYTYSDASGASFLQTNPVGTWRVVYDAGERGVKADSAICWTAQIPGQSILEVKVDASENGESVGDYDPNALSAIGNGDALGKEGRYVFVQVRFVSANQEGPILEDLTIKGVPRKGDVNGDGCVDLTDVNLVLADCVDDPANNNPDHDVNGDGKVTIADARKIVLLFCNPGGVPCN